MSRSLSAAVLVLVLAGGPALHAQQAGSEDRAAKMRERVEALKTRLKPTPEQTEKLEPIVRQELDEMRAIRDRLGADKSRHGRMTMMRELRAVQQKYEPRVNEILTPDQAAEWKKIKAERKQQLKAEYKKRQAGGG